MGGAGLGISTLRDSKHQTCMLRPVTGCQNVTTRVSIGCSVSSSCVVDACVQYLLRNYRPQARCLAGASSKACQIPGLVIPVRTFPCLHAATAYYLDSRSRWAASFSAASGAQKRAVPHQLSRFTSLQHPVCMLENHRHAACYRRRY